MTAHLPSARITFDKFHVVAHASTALDRIRRLEQKTDPDLKGLRWTLLKKSPASHTHRPCRSDALLAGKLNFSNLNPHVVR